MLRAHDALVAGAGQREMAAVLVAARWRGGLAMPIGVGGLEREPRLKPAMLERPGSILHRPLLAY